MAIYFDGFDDKMLSFYSFPARWVVTFFIVKIC